MLADRLKGYASASPAHAHGQPQPIMLPIAALAAPIGRALPLAATVRLTAALEALAQGDPCVLHAALCRATLPDGLIWIEVPAEEKERVRETILAARGQPLAPPAAGAAHAITLGYLVAREAETQRIAVSLVVEVLDPVHGPGLSAAPWELLMDLPTDQMTAGAAWHADACLDDLEGRLALRPSQWRNADALPDTVRDYGDLPSEALSIYALAAILGDGQRHSIRIPVPADGISRSALDFRVLDLPGPAS